MKLKIKVKKLDGNYLPEVIEKGDWVDLKAVEDVVLKAPEATTLKRVRNKETDTSYRKVEFNTALIPLGIAMKLPGGYEAVLLPRSSTFKRYGIIQTNSMGIIDNTYSSDNDEWKLPVVALKEGTINKGDRICQFRIQLSQKATVWQKIKWFLCSGIKIVEVDSLGENYRGGFGSTGK